MHNHESPRSGGWTQARWGELATLEYGRGLRGYENGNGPYRVYGTNGPIGWHHEFLSPHPTVVIGRKGAYRGVHYSAAPCFVIDTAFYLKPQTEFDMRWAYYALLTYDIDSMDSGSAIPSTSRDSFYHLLVNIPPLNEQREIAHILGTLDDKIELNRRMNETLEAMARAIFKSWFIDFDPVRRNMARAAGQNQPSPQAPLPLGEGQGEGVAEGIAFDHLFPDSFEDSPLGKIPKGWRVAKLSELCTSQYGYTASAIEEHLGPKLLRVTDINKNNWIEWDGVPHCHIEDAEKPKYVLAVGDIVVARMADPGKSAIIEDETDAVFASYLVRLKTSSLATAYYVYGFLKSQAYEEYSQSTRSGSVQANMNAKVILAADLVIPPGELIQRHAAEVLPLRGRIAANVRETSTLAATRDALLPKLISGEIRLKNFGGVESSKLAEA